MIPSSVLIRRKAGSVWLQGWLAVAPGSEEGPVYIVSQGSTGGAGFCKSITGALGHTWTEGLQVSSNAGSIVSSRVDITSGFSHQSGAVGVYIPTTGTMAGSTIGYLRTAWIKYTWTNAMVTALGAATTGNVLVCTLPARSLVKRCFVVLTGAAAGPTTVTVSVGRVATGYIDYVVESDAKAAENTVYGDAVAEVGTGLKATALIGATALMDDFPSYTGTTTINAQFVSSGGNLDTVTGSAGIVYLQVERLP